MAIKTREPGDAFKRQVAEYVPVKKRRPWRDEEEPSEAGSSEGKIEEPKPAREVQGATASKADFALDEDLKMKPKAQAEFARDGATRKITSDVSSQAKSAREFVTEEDSSTQADSALDGVSKSSDQTHAKIARDDELLKIETSVSSQAESAQVTSMVSSYREDSQNHEKQGDLRVENLPSRADFARDGWVDSNKVDLPSQAISALADDSNWRDASQADSAQVGEQFESVQSQAKVARENASENASSTQAKSALEEGVKLDRQSRAESSRDWSTSEHDETHAKSARDKDLHDHDKRNEVREVRQPLHSLPVKESERPSDLTELLPGTRKSRHSFVFETALRHIDNPSAGLLYCYLWHRAEEVGSAKLKISIGEMSEGINVSRRTVTDAVKRLSELKLFENVNIGKTTVPVVRLSFDFGSGFSAKKTS